MKHAIKAKGTSSHRQRRPARAAPKAAQPAGSAQRPLALDSGPAWVVGVLETASEIIICVDERRCILLFNKASEQIFGYSAREVLGQPLALLIPERYADIHERHIQEFAASANHAHGMSLPRTVVGRRKDGSEFPLEAGISKTIQNGQAVFTFIAVDLTEHRRVEETLAEERNLLRTLIDNLPDAVYAKDREGRFIIKNLADARRMGAASPEETIGKTDFNYYPPELAARYTADDRAVIDSGQAIVDREEPLVDGAGRAGWVSTNKVPLRDRQGNVIGLVGIGHDITEHKQAETQLQRRLEQFALLYEAGLALSGALEPQAQLETIISIACQTVRADRAEFFQYDPDRQDLRLAFGYPVDTVPPAVRGMIFALGQAEGLVGWVAQQRASLIVSDVRSEPRWRIEDPAIASAILVPLVRDEQLLGVLCLMSTRLDAFSLDDQRLLELLAAQAAVALENGRLFEEARRRLAELEAVNRVSTAMRAAQTLEQLLSEWLDVTLEVMRATAGSIWLYDRAKDELQPAALRGWTQTPGAGPVLPAKTNEGIKGHVFTTGEPYISSNIRDDPRVPASILERIPAGGGACLPIRVEDQVIGVFVIYLPRLVSPDQMQVLSTLSEIAGTAIHRTALHQQTERHLRHLVALREVDQAINSSFDLRISLSTLLSQVRTQLGADAADVLVYDPALLMLEFSAGSGFRTDAFSYTRLRLGEGHAGRAALERTLVRIPDLAAHSDNAQLAWAVASEGFVSYFALPLIAKGLIKGVLEIYQRTPRVPDDEWLDLLNILGGQAAIAIDNDALFNGLQRSNTELALAYDATIEGWSHALDLRDKETEGHTQRVAEATVRLALALGLREDDLAQVRWGALLHDIGKMGVPDSILLKPGPLTDEEWAVMRKHPTFAYEMIAPIRYLRSALDIPYCHHEKWDGTGYPRGLTGVEIPLAARIFAVVDVWDALSSDRPYRAAWTQEAVHDYIRSMAGTHFDPDIARFALESGLLTKPSSGAA